MVLNVAYGIWDVGYAITASNLWCATYFVMEEGVDRCFDVGLAWIGFSNPDFKRK